jgi:hypothetical protein
MDRCSLAAEPVLVRSIARSDSRRPVRVMVKE